MKYLKFFVVFSLSCFYCNAQNSNLITVDVEQAFDNKKEVLLSEFVESLEYIVLETNEYQILNGANFHSTDNYLVYISQNGFHGHLLFDRHTGKFIREIGHYGRGPEEYNIVDYFDYETQKFIARAPGGILLEYDLNGNMTRRFATPQRDIITKRDDDPAGDSWFLIGNIFLDHNTVVYYNNNTGEVKERLIIADVNGDIVNIFNNSNSNRFIRQNMMMFFTFPPIFYRRGDDVLFFETGVDSIYHVTKDSLFFNYHFKMGKYKVPYEKRGLSFSDLDPYFNFRNIGETDNFLIFDFEYKKKPSDPSRSSFFGYYNKKRNIVKIAYAEVDGDTRSRKIINDIDKFSAIQFNPYPGTSWSINDRTNELISYIEAGDIIYWLEQNPQKARELPEHLRLKLLKVKPEDNPIVVIAKLK